MKNKSLKTIALQNAIDNGIKSGIVEKFNPEEHLKTISLNAITDKHIGKRGTSKREAFEQKLTLDLKNTSRR